MTELNTLASLVGDDILLATKLYLPQPRPRLVARPQLVQRLNLGLQAGSQLTVVSAPPGFGKTTLLSEWLSGLRHTGSPAVAWLSLDARDNEPRRFFVYCIAALQTINPEIGRQVVTELDRYPLGGANPQTLVTILVNEMALLGQRLVFVLDDYHLINNETIHAGLSFLLENMPAGVHLVMASRIDVPISLALLRGRGQLTELRSTDLRFSADEAAAFLQQTMDLPLTAAEILLLEERTEGWIAGLQLAALSMQGHAEPDTVLQARKFSGSHRYIFDFLLQEVLGQQTAAVRDFLLQTAILERMCAPLCAALLSQTTVASMTSVDEAAACQQMLEFLDRANLFVVPLDNQRRWYRYHHLFADLLRELQQQNLAGEQVAGLHRRASDWLAQHGLATEAMHHALAAVDIPRIIRLAGQKASPLLSKGEFVTLLGWLDALPETLVQSQSGASLLYAWAMLLTGQIDSVEAYLEQAEHTSESPDSIAGEVATLRATVAYFKRDMTTAVRGYRQALAYLPADSFLRGCVVQSLGAAFSWLGQVVEASQAFGEASAISQNTANWQVYLVAQWTLAVLQQEQGQLHHAAEIFEQTIDFVTGLAPTDQDDLQPFCGRLHVGLAGVLLEQSKIDVAGRHLAHGLKLGEITGEAGTLSAGFLVQARLLYVQGNAEGALSAVRQARLYTGPYYLSAQVAAFQGFLWLVQGNPAAVIEWLKTRELRLNPLPERIPYLQEEEYLLAVRVALVFGRQFEEELGLNKPALDVAELVLIRIKTAARAAHRTGRVLETITLHALVYQARRQPERALPIIEEALALAERQGYARIFLDEGPLMINLLRRAAAKNISRTYVAGLLELAGQTLPGVQSELLLDPLSEREIEILRLIAAGKSNKELADILVLTVGTVKWHLNNIYSKLGVRSRTQAVARSRELGLVD